MVSSLINFTITSTPQGINWAEWITAISTLLMMLATGFMAYYAKLALKSWKEELRIKKRIEVYNKLHLLVFELLNFLEYFDIKLQQPEAIYIKNKLDEFSSRFALLHKEIKIINNKKLQDKIDYCIKNIKSTFIVEKDLGNEITYWPESFSTRFIQNKDFRENLNNTLKDISEICELEQQNFYK